MNQFIELAERLANRMGLLVEESENELLAIHETIEDHLEMLVTDDNDMFHVKQLQRLWVARQAATSRRARRIQLREAALMHYRMTIHSAFFGDE